MRKTLGNNYLTDILLLCLLIGGLYAFYLGTRSLGVPDEARYVEIPREMLTSNDFITPHLNAIKYLEKPPLFYWLQAGAIKLFGYHLFSYRLVTALLAVLGCIITYLAGRSLYDRKTGLYASFILASCLMYYCMAHYITLDMAVTVGLSATLFTAIAAMQSPPGPRRRKLFLIMYFCAALALLTKGLIAIVLPGMVIVAWLILLREWQQLKHGYWFAGLTLFLLVALPWHILMQWQNPEFFHYYVIEQHFLRYATLQAAHYQPLWWFLPITLLGLYPWSLSLLSALYHQLWQGRFTLMQDKTTVFLWLWFILILAFYSFSNSKLIPYVLPIMPAAAVLIARELAQRQQSTSHWLVVPSLLAFLFGCALLLLASLWPQKIPLQLSSAMAYRFAALLLCTALSTAYFYLRGNIKWQVYSVALAHSILFAVILATLPMFDDRSIKPLADVIKATSTKDRMLVSYNHYFQDLPVYLHSRIYVVNAREELADGMKYQDTRAWMLNDVDLVQHWQTDKHIFLVVHKLDLQQLQRLKLQPLYVIAQTRRDLLLSNRLVKDKTSQ
jgi:4-amino-4-deoxy-L-arabinose transferase-like glycosyltransferase